MANTLTAYTPEFWALLNVDILRETIVFPQLVRMDWSADLAEAGDTVNTRRPAKLTTNDFTNAGQVTVQNLNAANIPITLNQHKEVTFEVTDREQSRSFKNIVDEFMEPSMLALGNDIDTAIASEYANLAVTINITNAADLPAKLRATRTQLNKNLVPQTDRSVVLSDDDEGALLENSQFTKVNEAGDGGQALRNGQIGRLYGFDLFRCSNVQAVGSPAVRQNIALHKNAIAMVNRPLSPAKGDTPGAVQAIGSNPESGLSIRMTHSYQHTYMKTLVTFDVLYGVKTLEDVVGIAQVDSAIVLTAAF